MGTERREPMPDIPQASDARPGTAELLRFLKKIFQTGDIITTCASLRMVANRHWLPVDFISGPRFIEKAVEAVKVNITPFAPTIAVYCYAIDQAHKANLLQVHDNQFVQYRALASLRLEYYGMALLALSINVADKLKISPEAPCAYSAAPHTIASSRVLIKFLTRLRGQSRQYRDALEITYAEIIDITGLARNARLRNPQFFLELSTVKNAPLAFLWVCVQRQLTSSKFTAVEIKLTKITA
uniref:Cyclin N-terminal domain-containing protein n=1 Tax=Angiostrongylus cantonensis TaxID=6313 RepID=A0A0K0D6T3_ANGCA